MTLTDLLRHARSRAVYDAFAGWSKRRGLALYPHQEEALIEVVSGRTSSCPPDRVGQELVAAGAHFAALAAGQRTFYTRRSRRWCRRSSSTCAMLRPVPGRHDDRDGSVNASAPIICCTRRCWQHRAAGRRAADAGQVVMDEFHFYADPIVAGRGRYRCSNYPRAVRADVRDAGGRQPVRGGPDQAHRPATAVIHSAERPVRWSLVRHGAAARDAERAAQHRSGPSTCALHAAAAWSRRRR